jgi:hypothetical protein
MEGEPNKEGEGNLSVGDKSPCWLMKGHGAWSIFSHTTVLILSVTAYTKGHTHRFMPLIQYSYCLGKILLLLCKQHSTKILFYTTESFTSKAHEIPFLYNI